MVSRSLLGRPVTPMEMGKIAPEMDDVMVEQQRLLKSEAELETAFCTEQALAAQLAAAEATAQTTLAEASQMTQEALQRLSHTEKRRDAVAERLGAAEAQVERTLAKAEANAEAASANLTSKHQTTQRWSEEDLESFKVEMESRARAAEELLAAMQDERSLMMCGGLSALRGEALEARLNMSRQRITEACAAREAADKREAMAATAFREALEAEEEAAQDAVAEGLRESRVHEQRAAVELEHLRNKRDAAKAEADGVEKDAKAEVEALKDAAKRRCLASEEQAASWRAEAAESAMRTAERLRLAEVKAAQIWSESQKQIDQVVMDNEHQMESTEKSCKEQEAAAYAEEQRLNTEFQERLQMIRSEENSMEAEFAKALAAIEVQREQDSEDAAQRISSSERLERCLLEEALAVEEEIYAFEIVEEEACSLASLELKAHLEESAASKCRRVAEDQEALRPLLESLNHQEQRARKACTAAEEVERHCHQEAAAFLGAAEDEERQLQQQCAQWQEEVLSAKAAAQRRSAQEEQRCRQRQQDDRWAAEQRNRACWEEIAAENLEEAQTMESIRGQQEFLSNQAQDLMDTAARSEVALTQLLDSERSEESAAKEVRQAVLEVEAALRQVLEETRHQEAAIRARSMAQEAEIREAEAAEMCLAEGRWESAEVRAEMASQRCSQAVESTTSAKRQYQEEMDQVQKEGERKEASAAAKLLEAEHSLATALWWCGKQSQIGLKIFTADELASRVQVDAGDRTSLDGGDSSLTG